MNEKQSRIKVTSKVIAVFMKIGYIVCIVAMCMAVANVIFVLATGGDMAYLTANGMTVTAVITDEAVTTASGLVALSVAVFVVSAFLFVILLITYKMFKKIHESYTPFDEQHVKSIKTIGILVMVMTLVGRIVDSTASSIIGISTLGISTDSTGIILGLIIFCLAYIFDYGCMLQKQSDETL